MQVTFQEIDVQLPSDFEAVSMNNLLTAFCNLFHWKEYYVSKSTKATFPLKYISQYFGVRPHRSTPCIQKLIVQYIPCMQTNYCLQSNYTLEYTTSRVNFQPLKACRIQSSQAAPSFLNPGSPYVRSYCASESIHDVY